MLNRIKSRRLTMIELFSTAANIYKKNIKTILFVSFFVIIPLFCINEWLLSRAVINLDYLYNDMMEMDMTAEINAMTSASLYNMISSIVQMVLQPLVNIAIIWGSVNTIKEQTNNAKDNFLYSFSKAPSAVWTTFLQVVFLFVMIFSFLIILLSALLSKILLILTIIVCVAVVAYFTTIWIFADCVVAIQNMSGLRALIASKKAVQYRFWETFLCMLLFGVLSTVINIGVTQGIDYVCDNSNISYGINVFCSMIWSVVYHIVINGFYITFLVVLFLNIIWANPQTVYSTEIKKGDVAQIEQKTDIEQTENIKSDNDEGKELLKSDETEKLLIQEQKSDINLNKATEVKEQNQKDEQKK